VITCITRPAELRNVSVVSVARLRELLDFPDTSEYVSSIARLLWLTNCSPDEKFPFVPDIVTPRGDDPITAPPPRLTTYDNRPPESSVTVPAICAEGDRTIQLGAATTVA
jgi:hypothetical protein